MVLTSAQTFQLSPPLVRPYRPSVTISSHCFAISPRKPHTFFRAARSPSRYRGSDVVEGTAGMVARASTSQYSANIAEDLADVSIFTAAGEPVMFKDLWNQNEGIAVVVLLRHFGCPCCWELASALKEYKSKFESAGVKLIAVGIGAPNKARILAERLPFPMDCLYADPECKAYNVLGLYYGFGRTFFNPASAKVLSRFDALREAVKNYSIEATPDDRSGVLQQGGCLYSKGSSCCMRGRTKARVTTPLWKMFLISAAQLLLPDFASHLFCAFTSAFKQSSALYYAPGCMGLYVV